MHAPRVWQTYRVNGRGIRQRHRRQVKETRRPDSGPRDCFQLLTRQQEHAITLSIHFLLSYKIISKCNQQLTRYFKDTPNLLLFYSIYI